MVKIVKITDYNMTVVAEGEAYISEMKKHRNPENNLTKDFVKRREIK